MTPGERGPNAPVPELHRLCDVATPGDVRAVQDLYADLYADLCGGRHMPEYVARPILAVFAAHLRARGWRPTLRSVPDIDMPYDDGATRGHR